MSLAAYDKLLADLAERCDVRDPKTLRKSKELISLLNSKQSIHCSEICKVLVCLELAASLTAVSFSRDFAVKLSGSNKRNYVNIFNNISKLLNLDKVYSIKEICLLVGVSQIADVSLSLFQKYKAVSTADPSDLEHPMYSCASVLAICNEERHPVNLTRLVEISRIKKTDLKKLSLQFAKLYEKRSGDAVKKLKDLENSLCDRNSDKKEDDYMRDKQQTEMTDEEYKDWKRRMLEED